MDDVVSVGPWHVDPQQLLQMRREALGERVRGEQWQEAVLEAEEILEVEPNDTHVLSMLSEALLALGESELARQVFEQRLRLGSDEPETLLGHGLACYELCDLPMALESLREAVRRLPKRADAHFSLGLTLEAMGRKEAEESFSRARVLDPDAYPAPMALLPREWEAALREALELLPEPLAAVYEHVPVAYVELPDLAELRAHSPPLPPTVAALLDGDPGDDEEVDRPDRLRVFTRTLSRQPTFDDAVNALAHALAIEAADWLGVDLSAEEP